VSNPKKGEEVVQLGGGVSGVDEVVKGKYGR